MKEKMSQLFKDKVFLVLLVLGLLTIVAAAGGITLPRGKDGLRQESLPFKEETMAVRVHILKYRIRRASLQKRRFHRRTR